MLKRYMLFELSFCFAIAVQHLSDLIKVYLSHIIMILIKRVSNR